MDKKELIKYAAMAAGAYLIYKYFLKDMIAGLGGPSGQPAANLPAHSAPPLDTTVNPPAPPPPAPVPPPTSTITMERIPDETLHRQKLVSDTAYASKFGAGGVTLGADQWNFYRQQLGLPIRDAGELPNRGPNLTVFQYLSWLGTGSLSGLGYTYNRGSAMDYSWLQ